MMLNVNREVCVCNHIKAGEVAALIKEESIETLEELLSQGILPLGNKCKSCREHGFDDDGFSLTMILTMVKQRRI